MWAPKGVVADGCKPHIAKGEAPTIGPIGWNRCTQQLPHNRVQCAPYDNDIDETILKA